MSKYFVKGAWLYTMDNELSEEEFIERAGGMEQLERFSMYPYVTLFMEGEPVLRGHTNGRIISLENGKSRHWQTMEWL